MDEGRSVELHPRGQAYLHHNLAIVTGLCRWNRVAALPRNNPTVPTVAGKLAEPGPRELARRFWRMALVVRRGRGTKRNAKAQRGRGAKGYDVLCGFAAWCEALACRERGKRRSHTEM